MRDGTFCRCSDDTRLFLFSALRSSLLFSFFFFFVLYSHVCALGRERDLVSNSRNASRREYTRKKTREGERTKERISMERFSFPFSLSLSLSLSVLNALLRFFFFFVFFGSFNLREGKCLTLTKETDTLFPNLRFRFALFIKSI